MIKIIVIIRCSLGGHYCDVVNPPLSPLFNEACRGNGREQRQEMKDRDPHRL